MAFPGFSKGTTNGGFPKAHPIPDSTPALGYAMTGKQNIEVSFIGLGNVGSSAGKTRSATLAPNGFIYCTPFGSANPMFKINTRTNQVSVVGAALGTSFVFDGTVLGPDGLIYGIPSGTATTVVRRFNPETETWAALTGALGSGANKWAGGVLAPNGKIYGVPSTAATVLEIDPVAGTATTFGSVGAGTLKWTGGVLAPNGLIYCAPYNADSILVIDPVARTTRLIGSGQMNRLSKNNNAAGGNWYGGVLAGDGKIYFTPYASNAWLVVDPISENITSIQWQGASSFNGNGTSLAGPVYQRSEFLSTVWFAGLSGGTLAPDGKIYAGVRFASTANTVEGPRVYPGQYNPETNESVRVGGPNNPSGYTQQDVFPFMMSCMGVSGNVYIVPYAADRIMMLSGFGAPQPQSYTMPSNLADLPYSLYNRYMNR